MQGSLGEKIGEGATADVHTWAPGQVVKLFKPGRLEQVVRHEARMTRAAFTAGLPASEVLAEVTLDGRFGIVLTRLDGPTLLQLLRAGTVTSQQAATILATLALSVHRTPPPAGVLSLRDWMGHALGGSGGRVPAHIATGVLAHIERLPPDDGLCHGDLHLDNVIMTAAGPRLIDWIGMVRAGAALDLAYCHMILSEIAAELTDDPARPRALSAAVQSEYARLAGMSEAALTAAIEPYLPVVRAVALITGMWPGLREGLIQRTEAALR